MKERTVRGWYDNCMAPQKDASNGAIAELLRQIGEYLAMQQVPFKPRAYEKAGQTIDGLEESVADA